MANSRVARFVMEVAPPQFVSVMRHRTVKMMDTIKEEEKDGSAVGASVLASSSSSSSSSPAAPRSTLSSASESKYFLRGVNLQQSFSMFDH